MNGEDASVFDYPYDDEPLDDIDRDYYLDGAGDA